MGLCDTNMLNRTEYDGVTNLIMHLVWFLYACPLYLQYRALADRGDRDRALIKSLMDENRKCRDDAQKMDNANTILDAKVQFNPFSAKDEITRPTEPHAIGQGRDISSS